MTGAREHGWVSDTLPGIEAFPIAEVDVTLGVLSANALFVETFGPFGAQAAAPLRPLCDSPAEAELLARDIAAAIQRGGIVTRVLRLSGQGGKPPPPAATHADETDPGRGPRPGIREWTVTVSPVGAGASARPAALLTFHPAPTAWESSRDPDITRRGILRSGVLRDESGRSSPDQASDLWRVFLEQMPAIGWIRDADNRYLYINPAYCHRYGIQSSDRLGKTPFDVWPREIASRFQENDRLVLARGTPLSFVEDAPDPDGTPQVWFNTKFPITDSRGRHCLAGLGVNATHHTHAQQELWRDAVAREVAEARAEVEEQSRLIHLQSLTNLSMLVAGAVHDFNNHMAAASLFSTLARENARNPELVETYSRQIEQATAAAADLCHQLMNTRTPTGSVGFRPVDLAKLVRSHEPLLRSIVRSPHTVEFDLPVTAPQVLGDPVQLRQVLVNLVMNGAEACQAQGRIQVRVRVVHDTLHEGDGDEDVLSLEVVDNGPGISQSARRRLFEPFFTTKPGGHGIGLSAAAAIAARHCARLELVPDDAGGTIARLLLPLDSYSTAQRQSVG